MFLIFYTPFVFGQNSKKDSLLLEISKCSIDSNKVELLFELGRQYDYFKSKERIEYFIDAAELSKSTKYIAGIKKTYPTLITNLYHRNMNDVAMGYAIEYIQYLEKYNFQEDLLKFYSMYGNLLCRQNKFKVARYHYDKAYNYYKSKKDYKQCANVFNNISILLLNTGEYDSAMVYNSLSAQIYKTNKDYSAYANSVLGLSEMMIKKGELESALANANDALSMYENAKIDLGIANASLVLGEINYLKNDYESALKYYLVAVSKAETLNFMTIKRDAYLGISKTYSRLKKFEKAYEAQLLYKFMDDSISSEVIEGKMMEMEVKYDISKKENLLKENEYQLEMQSKQRNQLLFLVAGSFVLLIVFFFAYRQKRKSNKIISEQKRLVDEKQKEIIDSINYARRIQKSNMSSEKHIEHTLNRLKKNNIN